METLTSTSTISKTIIATQARVKEKKSILSPAFWAAAEEMRFGLVPTIVTIVICLSGIAAAFAAYNGILQLALIGIPTAVMLSTIIAVAPMRIIFALSALTILIDISVFVWH